MNGYYKIERNILDYLFVSYPCFNSHCRGKILISLYNLYRNTRIQCSICKRECSFDLEKGYFESVQRAFDYLYRQLDTLNLLPLAFSTEISPKTVFMDDEQL